MVISDLASGKRAFTLRGGVHEDIRLAESLNVLLYLWISNNDLRESRQGVHESLHEFAFEENKEYEIPFLQPRVQYPFRMVSFWIDCL